jgi:D-alanine-D-alanine ligase
MNKPTRTILLFGGRSAEHEVSILSARSVANAASKERIAITPICIARDGHFVAPERSARILEGDEKSAAGDAEFSFEAWSRESAIDIVFPLIHGTGGEDGALQGYLEVLGLPYVGSGVTASAVGMDKVHMKQAFAASKLPMVDYVPVVEHEWRHERERVTRAVANALRLPYFVKPANSGSSVGVTKVKNDNDLAAAIEHALRFDEKVLVERGVDAREIELAVLGNDEPLASVAGEIVPRSEFYDYNAKYVDDSAELHVPAAIDPELLTYFQDLAIAAFRALDLAGMARVDFFLERDTDHIYINEVNTIPGFTSISMYPMLWEASGIPLPELVERLIALAIERHADRRR